MNFVPQTETFSHLEPGFFIKSIFKYAFIFISDTL